MGDCHSHGAISVIFIALIATQLELGLKVCDYMSHQSIERYYFYKRKTVETQIHRSDKFLGQKLAGRVVSALK